MMSIWHRKRHDFFRAKIRIKEPTFQALKPAPQAEKIYKTNLL